jgi:DNA-binding NarL/FixJ family response regulator
MSLATIPTSRPTAREIAIMWHIRDGASKGQCARILTISSSTVSRHMDNLYKKLDVHNARQCIRKMEHQGWL